MSNISVCRSFSCPYWSEGKKPEGGGSLGGYGCTNFTVAGHCPVSQVKGVIDTQYELFVPEGGSQNRDTMIALGIAHLVFRDIELPDQRGSRAAHIEFSKCAWESDGSSKDEELKLQVDALLREDPEMFQRLLQARDWES